MKSNPKTESPDQGKELQEIREDSQFVRVYGARIHNLRNIDVAIPRNKLTVITGLSGSGKSSLAFDTIYAEGQRRYIETLSSYARQFLGGMERPDVDKITGLSPVISIEQKSTNRNPRSTVGTITEIYDFLRLLFARAGIAYSYATGEQMVRYTDDQIVRMIQDTYKDKKIMLLAPLVRGRKGHYRELFEQIRKRGFIYVRIDGVITEVKYGLKVDRYKVHNIEVVIDKLALDQIDLKRLRDSVNTAMKQGKGIMLLLDVETNKVRYYSRQLMCPTSGISYDEPAPHTFSFNSPQGACPHCNGLGTISEIDINKIIPDPKLSIKKGGIQPLGPYKNSLIFWQLDAIANKHKFSLTTPIEEIPEDAMSVILYGSEESYKLQNTPLGLTSNYFLSFDGIIGYLSTQNTNEDGEESLHEQYVRKVTCPECKGTRLRKESLWFRIHDKNIAELSAMDIGEIHNWMGTVEKQLSERQLNIAHEILKEIKGRLKFLLDVGLYYLSLDRSASTLSGGESRESGWPRRLVLSLLMFSIYLMNPALVFISVITAVLSRPCASCGTLRIQ